MPNYGLLIVDEKQLKELKALSKNKSVQSLLADIEKATTPYALRQGITMLIMTQFNIDSAPQTKESSATSSHLTSAIAILISASTSQKPAPIEIDKLLATTIGTQLNKIITNVTDQKLKEQLERIAILLKNELYTETLAAFNKINPKLFSDDAQKITTLKQQMQLVCDATPPEQWEVKVKRADDIIKEQSRLYKADEINFSTEKIITQLNFLFDIVENSSQVETRNLVLSELNKIIPALSEEGLQGVMDSYIKVANPKRVSLIKIMQSTLKDARNFELLFANYFLNMHLSDTDRALAAPVLLVCLDINSTLEKLNTWMDLSADNEFKTQLVKNGMNILAQMILADRFGKKIPDTFLQSEQFMSFYRKVHAFDERLADQMTLVLSKSSEYPSRNENEVDKVAQRPFRSEKMPIDIEDFFKQRLAQISPTSPEYQMVLQGTAESLLLVQAGLWLNVTPTDLHNAAWTKKVNTTNITMLSDFNNRLTDFVAKSISDVPELKSKRERALFFANLMNTALANNDFNASFAIYTALSTNAVEKQLGLEQNDKVATLYKTVLAQGHAVLYYGGKVRYGAYREAVAAVIADKKPHIPLLPVMLADTMYFDENQEKNFPFWLKKKSENYQYVNTLQNALTDVLKRGVISSTLATIVKPKTQSAPGRLESTPAAAALPAPVSPSSAGVVLTDLGPSRQRIAARAPLSVTSAPATPIRKSISEERSSVTAAQTASRPSATGAWTSTPQARIRTSQEGTRPRAEGMKIGEKRAAPAANPVVTPPLTSPQVKWKAADISHESGTSPSKKHPGSHSK